MRYFCCGSLLLLFLALSVFILWFTYYVSDIFYSSLDSWMTLSRKELSYEQCYLRRAWARRIYLWPSFLKPELFCLLLGPTGFNCWFPFAPVFQFCCSTPQGSPRGSVATRCFCRVLIFVSSQYLSVIYVFLVMIHWWIRKPSRGPNN